MQIIQGPQRDDLAPCPYLPQQQKQYEFFFAHSIDGRELSELLATGWRKFGLYYFRPACPGCRRCIPLRVRTQEFCLSRSQRRIAKKNSELRVVFGPLRFSERVFEIYLEHSRVRFSLDVDREDFICNFFLPSCPSLQAEYFLGEELVAVGFLDRGKDCLSSVYFCFDPRYSERNLGTYSVFREIDCARSRGLPYYYLGYYVPGCGRMAYKDHFRPREHFDWKEGGWEGI